MRKLLVIDDSRTILSVAKGELERDYEVTTALSGGEGLFLLERFTPDLILLDLNMPGMDGKEVLKEIRSNECWKRIPVIFLTADTTPQTEEECLRLGADDYIFKPFNSIVMRRRISRVIELYDLRNDLEAQLQEKTQQVERVTLNSIMVIANIIDAKDAYTAGHSVRVAQCAEEIAKNLGWDEEKRLNLYYVALLHDIGKIGVPDAILNKPLALTKEEFDIIRRHPVMGGEILKEIHMIPHVCEGALYHHERFDGRGYPTGLKGKTIPEYARIITIADTYDAMNSRRVYRDKLPREKIIAEFERCNGAQFDPELGQVFIDMLKKGFSLENAVEHDYASLTDESSVLLNRIISEFTMDIREKAMMDSLTDLYNRRYFQEKLEKIWQAGHEGALFMIDLDNFKSINDRFGHIMGDQVILMLADTLKELTGEEDVVGRIGGDEFILFYTDVTEQDALSEKADKIISSMQKKLKTINQGENTSVSIGIALYPEHGNQFNELYKNTDHALYYVKENGKNDYHFYSRPGHKKSTQDKTADLAHVRYILEGRMSNEAGAYHVGFSDFQKIYDFVSRCVNRTAQEVQTMLLTLEPKNAAYLPSDVLEKGMNTLERAIVSSLRAVDVSTRYSSSQYVVILVDADSEGGQVVARRIVEKFYEIYPHKDIILTQDMQGMMPASDKSVFSKR